MSTEEDSEKAQHALEYAVTHHRAATIDTRDVLDRLVSKVEQPTITTDLTVNNSQATAPGFNAEIYQGNLSVLRDRFPDVAESIANWSPVGEVHVNATAQGPVIWQNKTCLDHPEKPETAADVWIQRGLNEKRLADAEQIVTYGFGSGYHLESLIKRTQKQIACIEPSCEVFVTALGTRDLRELFTKLSGLSVGSESRPPFIGKSSELLVRPQTQAVAGKHAAEVKAAFYGKRGFVSLQPKIGVVGPMQGGTLPITQYTYNSLQRLGQRARGLDLSGFNKGWHLVDEFVKYPPRQKLLHSAYVEMVSMVLLEAFTEKPVDIVICMAQAPISPRVLLELKKRGVITVLWFVEDYLRFTYWQETAQFFDFIFTIQRGDCIDSIKRAGAGEVHYLPTACDPGVHFPMTLSEEERKRWGSAVSFLGAGYHNRQQAFASLANMDFKIWGTEWPQCKPFDRLVQEQGRRLAPEEYVKIFNASDINLNLHSSTERDGVDPFGDFVNPRTFELAAAGAFQLVDERSLLPEVFNIGEEMVTFSSIPQLKEQIEYYLAHPAKRREVAEKSRTRALKEHTYDHRIEQMLSIIYASKFEHLKSRADNSPWSKMMERSKPDPELHDRCKKAFERGEEPNLDALISDVVTGKGKLTETEQKLLFLFHVRKQIIRMSREEAGEKA